MTPVDTRLPSLLKGDRPIAGVFVGFPSPALVEMCGYAGFDFVIIDNEHGPASIETTEHLIRAARCAGTMPVVRCSEDELPRVLDAGASGVQVPSVNTAEQARRIVERCKYPPMGKRSAAFTTRAGGYSFHGGPEQAARANEGVAIIPMLETIEAVQNLDAILDVKGIDAIFIGLSDLALSMGLPGGNTKSEVQDVVRNCIEKMRGRGIAPGILASSQRDFYRYHQLGARYLPMAMTSLIAGALREAVAVRRGAVG
jgi:4-hydroxy-2-oxoheptanedioate aldolase